MRCSLGRGGARPWLHTLADRRYGGDLAVASCSTCPTCRDQRQRALPQPVFDAPSHHKYDASTPATAADVHLAPTRGRPAPIIEAMAGKILHLGLDTSPAARTDRRGGARACASSSMANHAGVSGSRDLLANAPRCQRLADRRPPVYGDGAEWCNDDLASRALQMKRGWMAPDERSAVLTAGGSTRAWLPHGFWKSRRRTVKARSPATPRPAAGHSPSCSMTVWSSSSRRVLLPASIEPQHEQHPGLRGAGDAEPVRSH